MNTVCHSQLIYSFLQTQHERQIRRSLCFLAVLHTFLSLWIFLSFVEFPYYFLSGTMLHFNTVLLALCNSCDQSLSTLEEISCHAATHHTLGFAHSHLVLAVTSSTCTHPVAKICEFPCCFHFITTFLPAPVPLLFPSHVQHVIFPKTICFTIFTLAFLQWIHLPHCTHNAELAFTLKLQTPHELTLLLDEPSIVMPLLIITLAFLRFTFKPLLSIASFHFRAYS